MSETIDDVLNDDPIEYSYKYLVKANDTLYTIVDDELVEVEYDPEEQTIIDIFIEYGVDDVPSGEYLLTLEDFSILHWTDDEENLVSILQADVHANPFPQFIYTKNYSTVHESIEGISIVEVVATSNVVFAVSRDVGETWYKCIDGTWSVVDEDDPLDGMDKTQLNAITSVKWDEFITTNNYKFRIYLPTNDAEYTSIVVKYKNIK